MEVGSVANSRRVLVQKLLPRRGEIQNFRFTGVATGSVATPEPVQIEGSFSARGAPSMRIAAGSVEAAPVSYSVQGETLTFTATVDLATDTTITVETEAGATPLLKVSPGPEGLEQLIRNCWLAFDTDAFVPAAQALKAAIKSNWEMLDLPDQPLVLGMNDEQLATIEGIRPETFAYTRAWSQGRAALREFNRSCIANRTSYIVGPYSGVRLESIYSFVIEGPGRGVMHLFSDGGKPVFTLQSLEPNGAMHLPLEDLTVVLKPSEFKTTKASLQRSIALFLQRVAAGRVKLRPDRSHLVLVNVEASPYHFLYDHFYGLVGAIDAVQGGYTYACLENTEYLEVDRIITPAPTQKVYFPNRRQLGKFLTKEPNTVVLGISERLDQTGDPEGYQSYISAIRKAELPVTPEFEAEVAEMRTMDGIFWFGISGPGQKRLWQNQVECVAAMVEELDAMAAPRGLRLGIVIDGWTNSLQQRGFPSPEVRSDTAVFENIRQALGNRPNMWSLISLCGHEKLKVAAVTTAAVINAGTGAAFVSKLMRRPVLLRDNPFMMLNNAKTWDVETAEQIDDGLVTCAALVPGLRQDMIDFSIDREGLRAAFAVFAAKHLPAPRNEQMKDSVP